MPVGRPRKPTQIKIAEGNRGHRPIDPTEPKPEKVAPPCPWQLKGEARKEWRRQVKNLLKMGILTQVDGAALAGYCVSWARFLHAEEQLAIEPMLFKSPNGYPVISPWWVISNKALEMMNKFGTEFGFTPQSRTRIKGSAAPESKKGELEDPAAKYFKPRLVK